MISIKCATLCNSYFYSDSTISLSKSAADHQCWFSCYHHLVSILHYYLIAPLPHGHARPPPPGHAQPPPHGHTQPPPAGHTQPPPHGYTLQASGHSSSHPPYQGMKSLTWLLYIASNYYNTYL